MGAVPFCRAERGEQNDVLELLNLTALAILIDVQVCNAQKWSYKKDIGTIKILFFRRVEWYP